MAQEKTTTITHNDAANLIAKKHWDWVEIYEQWRGWGGSSNSEASFFDKKGTQGWLNPEGVQTAWGNQAKTV